MAVARPDDGRSRPLRRPSPVQLLVGSVAAAGSAVLAAHVSALLASPDMAASLGAALLVAVGVALADQLTLDLPHHGEVERFAFTDAVWIAAIVLAPAGAPTVGAALGTLGWQLLRGVPPLKVAYNVAQVVLALTAAELVWKAIGAGGPISDASTVVAAIAASLAAFAVNEIAVALVIALSTGERIQSVVADAPRVSTLQWIGGASIGLLAVLAWDAHPALVALVVPPMFLVFLAHREFLAGLVEREQMQDLAHTAERIAGSDSSRRLPTIGDSRRIADVTASLNRMLLELERSGGRERHLMRAAAAELRAPVSRMRADLATDRGQIITVSAQQRLLAELGSLERVLADMEDVVRIARADAIRPALTAVCTVMDRAAEGVAESLDGRVLVECSPQGGLALLDAAWVERAVAELLANAAEYAGGRQVALHAAYAHGGWRIEVCDHGDGVPPGHEEAVFEPFHRATRRGRRAGLGLALVRAIAEAHGGAAGLVNQPGRGATFWLRLPGPMLGPHTGSPDPEPEH